MAKQTLQTKKAVFLDRDGVLNEDVGYVYQRQDLKLMPHVPEVLKKLVDLGYLLVVITNQSGVARGKFGLDEVEAFNSALSKAIVAKGGPTLDHFYICPHHPDGSVAEFSVACDCRKPEPGLIRRAAKDLDIDLSQSWMIGDKDSDVGCALAAGVRPILIESAKYKQKTTPSLATIVGNLAEGFDEIKRH